jgi:hypothetical protein
MGLRIVADPDNDRSRLNKFVTVAAVFGPALIFFSLAAERPRTLLQYATSASVALAAFSWMFSFQKDAHSPATLLGAWLSIALVALLGVAAAVAHFLK